MNQKGMEMAIQIFIILFVLLAVAMLVLQMVSTQFEEQQKKMAEEEMKRKYNEQIASMNEKCSSLCGKANSDLSLSSKVGYCTQLFDAGLDVTKNSLTTDYTEDFEKSIAVGICEDHIYCPQAYECGIGGGTTLDMKKCREILCAYFDDQGFSADKKQDKLEEFISPGACYFASPSNQADHWYTNLFDQDGSGFVDVNEAVCPN